MAQDKSVGALWKNTSKDGKVYFSGVIGDTKIVVFENSYKEKESQPDYKIYKSKPKNESSEDIPF
jgi:uncharacterized protein (DUF736 family)